MNIEVLSVPFQEYHFEPQLTRYIADNIRAPTYELRDLREQITALVCTSWNLSKVSVLSSLSRLRFKENKIEGRIVGELLR